MKYYRLFIILFSVLSSLYTTMAVAQQPFISIQNLDGKHYNSADGNYYPEEIDRMMYDASDSSFYGFHISYFSDFSQYLSKYDNKGNVLYKRQIDGGIHDRGFGKMIKVDSTFIMGYDLPYNSLPGLELYVYNDSFHLEKKYIYTIDDSVKVAMILSDIIEYGDHIVAYGRTYWDNSFPKITTPMRMLWIDKSSMELDTVINLDYESGHLSPTYSAIDNEGQLTISTLQWVGNGNEVRVALMKINHDKEVIWRWESTKLENKIMPEYPFIQLQDSSFVILRQGSGKFNYRVNNSYDIINFSEAKDSIWVYYSERGFTYEGSYKTVTNLKLARNGDIIGCGRMYWQYREIDFDSIIRAKGKTYDLVQKCIKTYSPFIFRINKDGKRLWERAVVMVDPLDQVSPGSLHDIHENEDGTIIFAGRIGTFTRAEKKQGTPHNWDSFMVKLNADGCYTDYPCTKTKTFLQPSRVLPFFDLGNRWLLHNNASGHNRYARFSSETQLIDGLTYYVLQSDKDTTFAHATTDALYTIVNEHIIKYDSLGHRPIFDYHIFPSEEWRDTITLDTAYFTTLDDGFRTKEFIFFSNKDTATHYHYYHNMGCTEDFFFEHFIDSLTSPVWQICKFWHDGHLVYNDTLINCTITSTIHPDLINARIYPNPFDNSITIQSDLISASYTLTTIDGIITLKGNLDHTHTEINTHTLDHGIYFIAIYDRHGRFILSDKMVK